MWLPRIRDRLDWTQNAAVCGALNGGIMRQPIVFSSRASVLSRPLLLSACVLGLTATAAAPSALATAQDANAPDQQAQLLFIRAVAHDTPSSTFTIHADGKQLREINSRGGGSHWSPDGGRLSL